MAILRAAALAEGARRISGEPQFAPDEDRFTLLVAAAELTLGDATAGGARRFDRLTVWADGPPDLPEQLQTALGLEQLPAHLANPEPPAFAEMLADPSTPPGLHLAVDPASGLGARAIALQVGGEGKGGIEVSGIDGEPADLPTASSGSPIWLLRELLREARGEGTRVVQVPGSRLGLRVTRLGPFPGETSWNPTSSAPVHLPSSAVSGNEVELATVSEGAYLPLPTYLENLPSRWRLEAERCGACGKLSFPARGRCRHCGRLDGLTREQLPKSGGRVEAVTTVRPGAQPSEFDFQVQRGGAYDVVLVRLHPEVRVTLQVTDTPAGTTRIGVVVNTALRRLYPMEGAWRYGRKALPRLEAAP
ncbi:MAG: zinc ribbon domain-containing protein [Thermoplasmata archaeon]|nr:zinc ribbon domain-containing protein [Thermoplasmata archaeon]